MSSLEPRSLQRSEVHRHAEMASDSTGSGEHRPCGVTGLSRLPSRMLVEKHSRITAEKMFNYKCRRQKTTIRKNIFIIHSHVLHMCYISIFHFQFLFSSTCGHFRLKMNVLSVLRNRECESDQWCRTVEGDVFKTTFTWTIENYINRPEKNGKGGFLSSSLVLVHGPNDKVFKWIFTLYPRGDSTADDEVASIFMNNECDFDVKAEYQVSVIDNNQKNHQLEVVELDTYSAKGQGKDSWGRDIKLNVDQLKANPCYLIDGKHLILFITIVVQGDEKILSGSKYSKSQGLPVNCKTQVADDNVKIFADDQFSDVLVECDGQAFKCHRVILSARSPVFMAMFQAEMKETKTRVVTIKGYSAEAVKEMLHFIYTGSLTHEISEEMAKDLLRAANQYHLDLLKGVCEEKLCSTLVLGNSLEYLVLGDLHHASNLKAKALILVVTNMTDIVNTEDYKNFHKNHPDLALEMTLARFKKDEKEGGEKGTETERTNGN